MRKLAPYVDNLFVVTSEPVDRLNKKRIVSFKCAFEYDPVNAVKVLSAFVVDVDTLFFEARLLRRV